MLLFTTPLGGTFRPACLPQGFPTLSDRSCQFPSTSHQSRFTSATDIKSDPSRPSQNERCECALRPISESRVTRDGLIGFTARPSEPDNSARTFDADHAEKLLIVHELDQATHALILLATCHGEHDGRISTTSTTRRLIDRPWISAKCRFRDCRPNGPVERPSTLRTGEVSKRQSPLIILDVFCTVESESSPPFREGVRVHWHMPTVSSGGG